MNRSTLSYILYAVVIVIGMNVGLTQLSSAQTLASPFVAISTADLTQAGYSNITQQKPENGLYNPPAFYFWVNGGAKTKSIPNLLMVSEYRQDSQYNQALFKYGENAKPVSIAGATAAQIATLPSDKRVALNFSKGNYYFVIIGPNANAVQALASIIVAKI